MSSDDTAYDPWDRLASLDDVRLETRRLPPRRRGQVDFVTRVITLAPHLDPRERTCTLAHELVHLERGPVLVRNTPREERAVAAIAARRLVPLPRLAQALRWTDDPRALAEELDVDPRTVRARLANLTDAERAELGQLLEPDP